MATLPATGPQKRRPSRGGNQAIASELHSKFSGLIQAVSFKMGVTYSLAKEDREDLVATVTMKIFAVDWGHLHAESGGTSPENYCRSLILNSMRKEVRRIKQNGFRGLESHGPLTEIPQPCDDPMPESGVDGLEGRLSASEVAAKAQALLDPAEFMVVEMLFGFDGGGERTIEQTAKELGISRREVSDLSLRSIEKLRSRLKVPSVSFSE